MHPSHVNISFGFSLIRKIILCVCATALLTIPACGFLSVPAPANSSNSSSDSNGNAPEPPLKSIVTLRLANLTDAIVETEIYVTTNTLENTTDTLFVEDNLFTTNIGVAATGLLASQAADTSELTCTDGMVIGMAGGVFRDSETGRKLGIGLPRILQQGFVFDCNARITLVYTVEKGVYKVELSLEQKTQ